MEDGREREVSTWWDDLTDQDRIYWAINAEFAEESPNMLGQILYVVEKPWKWREEAYKYWLEAHNAEAAVQREGVVE